MDDYTLNAADLRELAGLVQLKEQRGGTVTDEQEARYRGLVIATAGAAGALASEWTDEEPEAEAPADEEPAKEAKASKAASK